LFFSFLPLLSLVILIHQYLYFHYIHPFIYITKKQNNKQTNKQTTNKHNNTTTQ
jgi:hypothetical protein